MRFIAAILHYDPPRHIYPRRETTRANISNSLAFFGSRYNLVLTISRGADGNSPFDEEYVRKLSAGDPEVQKHFISHFGRLLRIKLQSKLRSPQLIEDVRQETFLRVLQSFRKEKGGLQNPERLGAYVNSVCNNVMFESLRAATRHSQIPEDFRELIDDSADPARQVVSSERKQIVARVLEALPPKDRELLRQVYFEERDKDEICKDLKVNGEYLRVLVHRAKVRFKDVLGKLIASPLKPKTG